MTLELWQALLVFIPATLGALGLSKAVELWMTRRSRGHTDDKVRVDGVAVMSDKLQGWADKAEERAQRAELRAEQVEARLQARLDTVTTRLEETRDALERLEGRVLVCPAGPVCPIRVTPAPSS